VQLMNDRSEPISSHQAAKLGEGEMELAGWPPSSKAGWERGDEVSWVAT
jgi:hypothetical protein